MGQWYYGTPGDNPSEMVPQEVNGPHTKADIVYLITEGHIRATYLVKHDDWDDWKCVGDLPESIWKEDEATQTSEPPPTDAFPEITPEVDELPAEPPAADTANETDEEFIPLAKDPPETTDATSQPDEKKEDPAAQPTAEAKPQVPSPPPKEPRAAAVLSRFQKDHARCPDCTHTVSLWALTCPRCGRPTPGSRFAPPNAPSERAFKASIVAWAIQLAVSICFAYGYLMSMAEVEHNDRSGVFLSGAIICSVLTIRAILLVFYAQRSEIIRKTGLTISAISIAQNIRSFVASALVLENGLKAPEWAQNAAYIVANDWIPFEAATAAAATGASIIFIILAVRAKPAFQGKDPILAFFRGERARP